MQRQLSVKANSRLVGISARGAVEPEVYRVCFDVYNIVVKMLSANRALLASWRGCQFEFADVMFLLRFFGLPVGLMDADSLNDVNLFDF